MSGIVIIGAGHAGCNTAVNLRRSGFEDDITIFTSEDNLPYHRPRYQKNFLRAMFL